MGNCTSEEHAAHVARLTEYHKKLREGQKAEPPEPAKRDPEETAFIITICEVCDECRDGRCRVKGCGNKLRNIQKKVELVTETCPLYKW